MSAWSRDLPTSFDEAIRIGAEILSGNRDLVARDVVRTESEQIVIAAYRLAIGKSLTRMELFKRLGDRLPEAAAEKVIAIASSRADGKILQHLTGTQFFFEHEYQVSPDVLVPRPETEILVARAIELFADRAPTLGIEIGIGSGCIAIELLARITGLEIVASELTAAAEMVARANAVAILGSAGAQRLRISRATNAMAVWEPIAREIGDRKASFLVSNPPYLVSESEVEPDVLRSEPREALFSPEADPVYFYRMIALRGEEFLEPGAVALLEVPHERATVIRELFESKGWSCNLRPDLNGRDRVLEAVLVPDGPT